MSVFVLHGSLLRKSQKIKIQKLRPFLLLFLIVLVISSLFPKTLNGQEAGEIFYCGSRHSKTIAITIDDGWVDDWALLNLLAYYKIKCTVFLPGRVIVSRPEFLRQLVYMGFEIGNHSYSHHILDTESVEEIRKDIKQCEDLIQYFTPYANAPKYFRPSAGVVTENVIEAAKAEGYTIILWDNDIEGYYPDQTVEEQIEIFKSRLANGNIVLSHFGSTLNTAKVYARLIPELQKEGYRFVTVSELIAEEQRVKEAQAAVAEVSVHWLVARDKNNGPEEAIRRINYSLKEEFGNF